MVPAGLTLFLAAALVAASVMWGSHSWSNSLPLDPAVQQVGSNRILRIPASDQTLDMARVRLIADGVETSRVLDDLIPSAAEFKRRYPNGAVLVAAFGKPSDAETITRRWGWPIAWRQTMERRPLEPIQIGDGNNDAEVQLMPPRFIQLRLMYEALIDGRYQLVTWDFGPPALCALLVLLTYTVLGAVQAWWRRWRGSNLRVAGKGGILAAIVVVVLNVTSGGSKTDATSVVSILLPGGTGLRMPSVDWATVTEADVVSMVQEQADARRVAEVILDYLPETPNRTWVLHVALIHPMDVERQFAAQGVYRPLPLFFLTRSKIVRVSDSGEVEPAFREASDLVEWRSAYAYLHVPTGRSSEVMFGVHWGGVSVCLVFLWLIWMGVRRICLVCLGARTARRSCKRLCVCCAYPVPT